MLLFSQPGPHNTNAAAVEGIRKAKQLNTDLVFASSSGATVRIIITEARKQRFTGKLIDVRSVSELAVSTGWMRKPNANWKLKAS